MVLPAPEDFQDRPYPRIPALLIINTRVCFPLPKGLLTSLVLCSTIRLFCFLGLQGFLPFLFFDVHGRVIGRGLEKHLFNLKSL